MHPRALTTPSPATRVALLLSAVAASAGLAVPLLPLYRHRLGLDSQQLTLAFAVYAAGLIPALVLSGAIANRAGRRAATLTGAAIALGGLVILLLARDGFGFLLAGRMLQGVSSGSVFSAGTVWLSELAADGSGPRRATAAQAAGFSLGPTTAGILGAWGPARLTAIYLVGAVALAAALTACWSSADTHSTGEVHLSRLVGLPRTVLPAFLLGVAPLAILIFAFPTLAISTLSVLLPDHSTHVVAVIGLTTGVTMGSASLVVPAARRHASLPIWMGPLIGTAGVGIAELALQAQSHLVVVLAGILLGSAYGLSAAAGLARVEALVSPVDRAPAASLFYVVAYVGFAAPFPTVALADATTPAIALLALAGAGTVVTWWLRVYRPGGSAEVVDMTGREASQPQQRAA
jgi:MFS family permease